MSPITLLNAAEYYAVASLSSQTMVLPDDLSESIDCFFGLEKDDQQRFLRACFWFRQADRSPTFSVSFINLVQAIETLLPPAESEGPCPVCKKEIKPSLTKLFKSFMEEYAPISASGYEARQELYRIRSRLVHGQDGPFLNDMTPDGSLNPLATQEMEYLVSARQAVRIAMRNWLQPVRAKLWDKPVGKQTHFSVVAFKVEHDFWGRNHTCLIKQTETRLMRQSPT
jgi:hypothetical protein